MSLYDQIYIKKLFRGVKLLWNCTIGALQISYRSTMINPPLYCAIWKTNRFLNISPVSKQIQWRSTESILYNIGECCLMNAYIGTITLIRFAHLLWNTLGFLITSETLFHCKKQNSPIRPLSIHENSMVQKRLDHARKKPYQNNTYGKSAIQLLLKWDRRTTTDLVHKQLSFLEIDDVHIAKFVSFVNECRSCRVPDVFVDHCKTWETWFNQWNRSNLDIPWDRTDLGLSHCDIKRARLWNQYLKTTNHYMIYNTYDKEATRLLSIFDGPKLLRIPA